MAEGTCIKHHLGPVAIKMYDKFGLVLRIETTTNDPSFFKHHRLNQISCQLLQEFYDLETNPPTSWNSKLQKD